MKPQSVQAALEKLLDRKDVERLLRLNEVRQDPTLADTRDYQRLFIGYYKLVRKKAAFYKVFFELLHAEAEKKLNLSLRELLLELYRRTEERHLSFCSKLLATVDDSAVIFDSNVARYFNVQWPLKNRGLLTNWIDEAMYRYDSVRSEIIAFTRKPEWTAMRARFDETFPDAVHLSDLRKADLIIWAAPNDGRNRTNLTR